MSDTVRPSDECAVIWFCESDTPGPQAHVAAGVPISIVIGVGPADAANRVEVHYSVNQRPSQAVAAKWLWNDSNDSRQYFQAVLPPFEQGDKVQYMPTVQRAGSRLPHTPFGDQHAAASFRVEGVRPTAVDVTALGRDDPQIAADGRGRRKVQLDEKHLPGRDTTRYVVTREPIPRTTVANS